MSQFSTVTLEQAREAKKNLSRKLSAEFSVAVGGPVNGIGLTRISTAEWGVKVNLSRQPTKAEDAKLPKTHMGVKVRYEVVGPIIPY